MHRRDHKGQEKFGLNENNISVTWEFTSKDLNVSLFGYFTSKDETMKVNRHSRDNSEDSPEVRFICGTAVPLKVELPTQIPLGLQLIGAKIKSGIHHAVLCSCSSITKGTRYGPYKGTAVKPSDTANGGDTAFMWEVFSDRGLSHYIDGKNERENWMKFVNCARHDGEQNLVLVQDGDQIFYECCRDISMGEELLVWYGDCYFQTMGIPVGLKTGASKNEIRQKESTDPSTEYSCERCGKVFAYKYYRDRHLKYTRCVDQGDRKFPCTVCNRSFDKRDRLRIHVLHVHEKHRPHQCTECGKRFSQSSSLNKHMRVHSGERPYKCPHCVKAFTASSILRTHIRQHSGEKPFKCKHCERAFASHAAHDSHVRRTHTKEKPCVCEYCGKAFAQSYELKFHINMHTGAKPYTCEKCGRAFSSPSSRDRHRANFDCITRKNRAPKVMRKNQLSNVP
ncbi:PR domain zinc finger protein 14-like [Pocillopora verrucosa]|uniref:PR domain zinc finger protein 14-like n=1 Tax=Pocillopora verrucosa TaxID=203993 RepID=UPI0027978B77|nr:PR domain zinc finger protein 14-like [Pocillopora verrucosa]